MAKARPVQREWSGGAYLDREGIEIEADEAGITLKAWYDGGIWLEPVGRLSWDELDEVRREAA